jgi:hypothetical protein
MHKFTTITHLESENMERGDHFRDVGIDGRLLIYILKK